MLLDDLNDITNDNSGGGDPVYHETVSSQIDLPSNTVYYTSAITDAEALYIGFICPQGLYKIDNEEGILSHSITYTVFYKKSSETSWTHAFTKKVTAKTRQPIRWEETIAENLEPAEYNVAVINRNTACDEFECVQEIRIDYHKERRYQKFNLRNTAWYEVTLEANDQLNNSVPNCSVLVQGRKIRVYSTTSAYTEEWTNNPAWIVLDLLTNERYGLGLSYNRIDLQSFIDAADWFDTNDITLNLVLDGTKNARDIITAIQTATMCFIVQSGDKIRIVPDTTSDPVQAFSEDNIIDGSLSWQKASLKDKINRIVIDYLEENDDYQKATIIVDAPNIEGQPKEKKISLLGVTNYEQAEKVGKLLLNYSELAQTVVQFRTGAMGLAAEIGDVITITYSPAGWTDKQFRIVQTNLQPDLTVEITALEYSPDIYDLSGFHTWTPEGETTAEEAPNITGLSATTEEYVDVDNLNKQKIILSWTNPVDQTNWKGVEVWSWNEKEKYFQPVGRTSDTSFEILAVDEGITYKIAVVSINANEVLNAIHTSPQVEVFVDYATPPDLAFDASKCYWDGYQLITAVYPKSHFKGEYEFRTSDPIDWASDDSGLLGRGYSPVQAFAYQDTDAEQVTVYARGYYKGKYSENSASLIITKTVQDDNYITLPDFQSTYSENKLRNAAFLNTYVNNQGYVDLMYWDGIGPETNYGVVDDIPVEHHLYGIYALAKYTDSKTFSQTVTIRPVPAGQQRNYTLSWWSVWLNSSSNLPEILVEYLDEDLTVLGSEDCAPTSWQSGGTDWELFKYLLTAPENTNFIRVWIKGIAIYDAIMLAEGTAFPPFRLHTADVVDGVDTAIEEEASRNFQIFLENKISDIEERLGQVESIWDILNYDANVMQTKAFQIQARAIDLIAGDVEANHSRLTLLEDRVVLAVDANGYVSEFTMGTGAYGSQIDIKADQINVTGSVAFYSSDGSLQNTLIKGGAIQANSIIAQVNLSGACLEIAADDDQVYHETYGAYIEPKAVFGATLDPSDTDPTRLTIDKLGRIWSGAVDFDDAKFSVDQYGYLKATNVEFINTLKCYKSSAYQFYVDADTGTVHLQFDGTLESGSYLKLAPSNVNIHYKIDLTKYKYTSMGSNSVTAGYIYTVTTTYDTIKRITLTAGTDTKLEITDTYLDNTGVGAIRIRGGNLEYIDPAGNVHVLQEGTAASGDVNLALS